MFIYQISFLFLNHFQLLSPKDTSFSSKSFNCISFQGPKFWNSLSSNFQSINSLFVFKKQLKSWLVKKYRQDWFIGNHVDWTCLASHFRPVLSYRCKPCLMHVILCKALHYEPKYCVLTSQQYPKLILYNFQHCRSTQFQGGLHLTSSASWRPPHLLQTLYIILVLEFNSLLRHA